jgi:hypothetical protein
MSARMVTRRKNSGSRLGKRAGLRVMRVAGTVAYGGCKWCHGQGCLACGPERERFARFAEIGARSAGARSGVR